MHYSSFLGCINVEKTSEQCIQPPLPPENQKAVGRETETQVRSQMVDKWTVGLNKEGLYNGVKSPKEGGREKRERKNIKEELLQHQEEHHWKQPFYPKTCSSDLRSSLNHMFYSPRTNSQLPVIVEKPIINPILSPILLQIYCTGLIGPISFPTWVWVMICDPTIIFIYSHISHESTPFINCQIARSILFILDLMKILFEKLAGNIICWLYDHKKIICCLFCILKLKLILGQHNICCLYITETFETPTIFHVNTIFKK